MIDNLTIGEAQSVAQVIQLAIAPAFLFTGVAGLLNVLTNRLARIIDRHRTMDAYRHSGQHYLPMSAIEWELRLLDRRARLIHTAIALSTSSVLFICAVIIFLFVGSLFDFNLAILISVFFILSSTLLLISLLYFLNEVRVATRSIYGVSGKSQHRGDGPT